MVDEAHRRGLDAMAADELAIEPGGGLGRDLPVEGKHRSYFDYSAPAGRAFAQHERSLPQTH